MPSRETLRAFIATVEQGKFDQAIADFYAEAATMQENLDPPRGGRDALVQAERGVMARFKEIRAKLVPPLLVDGDHVVINWQFEFEGNDGRVTRLDELARQRWQGEKVVEERFYYDPKQMRG